MLIERIRVENFRTLKGPIEIRLGSGLNLIHGANEAGKSTLVEAIFTAFTVKAATTGAIQREIRSRDGAIASVSITVSHRGASYTISKRFGGASGTVRIQIRGAEGRVEELSSDDAEARIRTLLGIEYRTANARGTPTALGLLPLLFVRQGDGTQEPSGALGPYGKVSLTSRLASDAGSILGGSRPGLFEPGCDRLFERAKRERDRYFQDGNDQWRRSGSPAADAAAHLERARIGAASLSDRARAFEDALDRHARVRASIAKLQGQLPAIALDAESASKRLEDVRRLSVLAEGQRHAAAAKAAEQRRLSERADDRRSVAAGADQASREERAARSALDRVAISLAGHAAARGSALGHAEQTREEARELARRAQRAAEHARALEAHAAAAELEARGSATCDLAARLIELEAKRAQGMAQADVNRLEVLERALDRSELALESACAGVRITARQGVSVSFGGERRSLAPGETLERRIRSATIVEIADLIELAIEPGGAGINALEKKVRDDQAALERALLECGSTSASEARGRCAARREAEIEIGACKRELAILAPAGREELGLQRAALGERALAGARRALELSVPTDEVLPSSPYDAAAAAEVLQRARAEREVCLAEAERALVEHDLMHERMLSEQAGFLIEVRAAERRLTELRGVLARSIEELGDDQALVMALESARAEHEARERTLGESERALAEVDAAVAEIDAERAELVLAGARAELERLRREEAMLCGELQAADLIGLHEHLDEAKAREAEAAVNLKRIELDGAAARLLHDTLSTARDEARRKYLAPLRSELESLLALLFPAARIVLDDQFGIAQLDRAEEGADNFASLSFGTREQVAILTRLAFARILAAGDVLPVILDDALAASDPERAARMANVLFRAAKDMQIIVLTCDPERYRRLGCAAAQAIDLNDLQRRASEGSRPRPDVIRSLGA